MTRKIFISSRRDDSRYQARQVYRALVNLLPADNVFMDVDSIPPGQDIRRDLPDWEFLGLRAGTLLREAYAEAYAGSGSIEGLLRYRFARRLKEAGVKLKRIVEWFENQEIDHGAVSGWLTFHPDTKVVGYQGFLASNNYLCMFPLEVERALGLLPHVVGVMGPALVTFDYLYEVHHRTD